MPLRDLAKELGLLLGLAVLGALIVNSLSPRGISLKGEWDPSRGVITARGKNDVVVRDLEIPDVRTAKAIYDGGKAFFVDARSQADYARGHIQGAVSFPAGEFDRHMEKFRAAVPASQPIVTYCSGRECDDSHELARRLFDAGYVNVSVFIDGYPAWEAEGFPVEP